MVTTVYFYVWLAEIRETLRQPMQAASGVKLSKNRTGVWP
jgi:hypothetical protein